MNQMTVEETKKIKRQAPNPPTNGIVQKGEENEEVKDSVKNSQNFAEKDENGGERVIHFNENAEVVSNSGNLEDSDDSGEEDATSL